MPSAGSSEPTNGPSIRALTSMTADTNVDGLRVYADAGMHRAGADGQIILFEA